MPKHRITHDWETRSAAPLGRVGVTKYWADVSTALDCLAYKVDSDPVRLWVEGEPQPEVLRYACGDPEWEFHAFNANFEQEGWMWAAKNLGWAQPSREQWHCTQARAGHANLPISLADCSAALGLPDGLGKSADGRAIMLKTCKPDRFGRWIWEQQRVTDSLEEHIQRVRELYEGLYRYCKTDVVAEDLIHRITPDLSANEQEVWQLHQKINKRGIPVDLEFCHGAVRIVTELRERTTQNLANMTDGLITTGNQVAKILEFVNDLGVNIGNLRKDTVAEALDDPDLHPDAATALIARQAVSSAAASKYQAAIDMAYDGRVRDQFQYYGASTGRWAGRGLQVHNLKRGNPDELFVETVRTGDADMVSMLFPKTPIALLGDMCRGIIAAPAGRRFGMADFSQIEARVVHWLAGDRDTLRDFHEQDQGDGPDKYQKMAGVIYNVPANSIGKGTKRDAGKAVILGAGYGMGGPRFAEYAALYGVSFTDNEARSVINKYRAAHPAIPQLWQNYERAAREALRRGRGSAGRCFFDVEGDWLTVQLPSGRKLYYHQPHFGPDPVTGDARFSYVRRGTRVYMWGGVFTENITQAVARDILVDAMLRLDKAGFDLVLHVHDEVLAEFSEDEAADGLVEMQHIMRTNPDWCREIPLFSEGDVGTRFKK